MTKDDVLFGYCLRLFAEACDVLRAGRTELVSKAPLVWLVRVRGCCALGDAVEDRDEFEPAVEWLGASAVV